MSTIDRNTLERVPQMRSVEAAAAIPAGVLVAITAEKKAVPAADVAGLLVIGRSEHPVAQGERVTVKAGCFALDIAANQSAGIADIGKTVFVVNSYTISLTPTVNCIKAGVIFDVDEEGVWVICGNQNFLNAVEIPDLSAEYLFTPFPGFAEADLVLESVSGEEGQEVYAAGENSADLLADLLALRDKLNVILAVLRLNGFIEEEEEEAAGSDA